MLRCLDRLVELLLFIDSSQDQRESILASTARTMFFMLAVLSLVKIKTDGIVENTYSANQNVAIQ